jgi:hypothetical protein
MYTLCVLEANVLEKSWFISNLRRKHRKVVTRLSITGELLEKNISCLPVVCKNYFEAALFKAALSLAFHVFFRI